MKVKRWLEHVLRPKEKKKAHNALGENQEVTRPLVSLGIAESLILK